MIQYISNTKVEKSIDFNFLDNTAKLCKLEFGFQAAIAEMLLLLNEKEPLGEYQDCIYLDSNKSSKREDEISYNNQFDIKLHPNPTINDEISINFKQALTGNGIIEIYTTEGKIIKKEIFLKDTNKRTLKLNGYKGVLMIRILSENGEILFTDKIISH